ncbi:MAG: antitermination protein NusG [Deltaproteobacteria bacterium]|nr:MAG: antitermination protein NusG [Deltaproteobacteria bacterium]
MEDENLEETGSRQASLFPSWYAIYTMSRHEAKVEKILQQKGLEVFLPRVITGRRRRGRKAILKLPLFPGYLFVLTGLGTYDYHQILKAPGVVRILGNGRPIPVPEETVGSVRAIMESDQPFYPWRYLENGKQVRVLDGPLAGTVGIIQGRKEKKRRLIVSVELFRRSVAVELDDDAVEHWS